MNRDTTSASGLQSIHRRITNITAISVTLSAAHHRVKIADTNRAGRFFGKDKLAAMHDTFRLIFSTIAGIAPAVECRDQPTLRKTEKGPNSRPSKR
ncbi:hypothetical protein D3C78_1460900 [compost metagenome]